MKASPRTIGRLEGLTIPELTERIAFSASDYVCLVAGSRRIRWAELLSQVRRFADTLTGSGIGIRSERSALAASESGQDHVALMLRNGPEYIEAFLGSLFARAASFNVNYRYTATELERLFEDAKPRAIVVGSEFAPVVRAALSSVNRPLVLQVDDGHGRELIPGARWYQDILASSSADPGRTDWSPDDLYLLYTGGTTGMPKGVMWRQTDALVSAFNVCRRDGREFSSNDEAAEAALSSIGRRVCVSTPPLIHGAAQWFAIGCLLGGGRLVIPPATKTFAPEDLLNIMDREEVGELLIVGDAFGRPLLEELERAPRSLTSLRAVVNGGAALSESVRSGLLAVLPKIRIIDTLGSSESGRQASRRFSREGGDVNLEPLRENVVLSADLSRVLTGADGGEVGWLARSGRVPVGYLGDPIKTRATFPVIGDVRYAVPGDRARVRADGSIMFVGRDSSTINTGGEKVFVEEVEDVLKAHALVHEAIVLGRPSERWGEEIVAVVAADDALDNGDLVKHAASHLARYKLPKEIIRVRSVPRTVAGKADRAAVKDLYGGASMENLP